MGTIDLISSLLIGFAGAPQRVGHVDAFDDEDLPIQLDLSHRLRGEVSMTCVDAARLQRASKGAGQSAGRRDRKSTRLHSSH